MIVQRISSGVNPQPPIFYGGLGAQINQAPEKTGWESKKDRQACPFLMIAVSSSLEIVPGVPAGGDACTAAAKHRYGRHDDDDRAIIFLLFAWHRALFETAANTSFVRIIRHESLLQMNNFQETGGACRIYFILHQSKSMTRAKPAAGWWSIR